MAISTKKDEKLDKLNEWREEKEKLAIAFFDEEHSIKEIKVSKGEIYNCYLGENIGHEQCKTRPVLIISSDFFNDRTSTVTVAPLSTTIVTKEIRKDGRTRRVLRFKSQYRLHQWKFNYLAEDSVVKLDQLKTVCKSRLQERLGCLDEQTQTGINQKIINYLDLKI
ncbi:type II toxin-antitoxin system PemK/MazF family toxin [Bacillus sp. S13(2024)]|uniref:type II toxin-antitoxin system PemK/MazF family toxin n=1 Tax=unclassified Bacillus (in: firmicutes) TaxID=185979 RepID=UPI003D205378